MQKICPSKERNFFQRFWFLYLEGLITLFFLGTIITVSLFSWMVAESSWNLDHFVANNLPSNNEICIYVEGAVEKAGSYKVAQGSLVQEILAKAHLEKGAYPWKKIYRKRLQESGSLFFPYREGFSPSWEDPEWMEEWRREF